MERAIGLLFSGLACKAYAGAAALWITSEVWGYVSGVLSTVQNIL